VLDHNRQNRQVERNAQHRLSCPDYEKAATLGKNLQRRLGLSAGQTWPVAHRAQLSGRARDIAHVTAMRQRRSRRDCSVRLGLPAGMPQQAARWRRRVGDRGPVAQQGVRWPRHRAHLSRLWSAQQHARAPEAPVPPVRNPFGQKTQTSLSHRGYGSTLAPSRLAFHLPLPHTHSQSQRQPWR
jgi:hypothetical protein